MAPATKCFRSHAYLKPSWDAICFCTKKNMTDRLCSNCLAYIARARNNYNSPACTIMCCTSQKTKYWPQKWWPHPKSLVVNIFGIEIGDCGHSCKEHENCGSVLSNVIFFPFSFLIFLLCILQSLSTLSSRSFCSHDTSHFSFLFDQHNFLQFQFWDAGKEEAVLAVYWEMDGVDRCQVGFFPSTSSNTWTSKMVSWHRWWTVTAQWMITNTGNKRNTKTMVLQTFFWFWLWHDKTFRGSTHQYNTIKKRTSKEATSKEAITLEKMIHSIKENVACIIILKHKIMSSI